MTSKGLVLPLSLLVTLTVPTGQTHFIPAGVDANRVSEQAQLPEGAGYITLIQGEDRRALTIQSAQVTQAKAKGHDLATLAKDEAVTVVLAKATSEAAMRVGAATIGSASAATIPVVGVIVTGGMILMGKLHKPTVTSVMAIAGQSSSVVANTSTPKFEAVYENIAGVNPDEFEPVIVKLTATPNNWRLVYARRVREGYPIMEGKFYSDLAEERVPIRSTKLHRGDIQIEPTRPLDPGEYAVVLRPVSQTKSFSAKNGPDDLLGFSLTLLVCDFAIKN
jgi:hypothetical protein